MNNGFNCSRGINCFNNGLGYHATERQAQICMSLPEPSLIPEDVEKYDKKAQQIINDLKPGESTKWEDAVRTAKILSELDDEE